jgi:hypothetical protein
VRWLEPYARFYLNVVLVVFNIPTSIFLSLFFYLKSNLYFSVLSGILTPKTDTCLTARTALTLIATSRSNVVIITLAREIAKHALAQSGTASSTTTRTTTPSQTSLTIKNEQKNEILRLIKILIEKCPHDVAELILEVKKNKLIKEILINSFLSIGYRYYFELY